MKKKILIKESQFNRIHEYYKDGINNLNTKFGTYIYNPKSSQLFVIINGEWIEIGSVCSSGEYFVLKNGFMYYIEDPQEPVAILDFVPTIKFQLERLNDTDYYFYENKKTYNIDGEVKDTDSLDENFFENPEKVKLTKLYNKLNKQYVALDKENDLIDNPIIEDENMKRMDLIQQEMSEIAGKLEELSN